MSDARTQCDCCHAWVYVTDLHWSVGDRVCSLCWESRCKAHADTVGGMMIQDLPFQCWHGPSRGKAALLSQSNKRNWGVFDTWQGRWCPRQWTSYDEALTAATKYNEREAIGSRRYQAQRRPES